MVDVGINAVGAVGFKEATTEILIASGVLIPVQAITIVGAESGTSDDLDTVTLDSGFAIATGYPPIIFLTATIGDTVTVKHNTGNILNDTGADLSLTENKCVILVRIIETTNSIANSKWRCAFV